ncbi:hypothetical protein CHUAL_013335 [Chamberlinius hualienensis]
MDLSMDSDSDIDASGRIDINIPDQKFTWTVKCNEKTKIFDLEDSPYKLKFCFYSPRKDCSILKTHLCNLPSNMVSNNNGDQFVYCPFAISLQFKPNEEIGLALDVNFGSKISKYNELLIGDHVFFEQSFRQLNGRRIYVKIFNPEIKSYDGAIKLKIHGMSGLEEKLNQSIGQTMRGPTFYTEPNGYRVKLEFEMIIDFIVKITFLTGENDHNLPRRAQHEVHINLFNDRSKTNSGFHDTKANNIYLQSLGSLADLLETWRLTNRNLNINANKFQY